MRFQTNDRSVLFTFITFAAIGLLAPSQTIWADEGGLGVYLPGVYGTLGMAELPPDGFYFLDFPIYGALDTPIATKGGILHIDIDSPLFANAFVPAWFTDKKIFGGHYGAAFAVVLMGLEVDSQVQVGMNFVQNKDSNTGFGDVYGVPLMISWQELKNHKFLVYEGINIPLGEYQLGACCNLGLNYWAFDTNLSYTYDNEQIPVQFDANLGYMYNLRNSATDYKSGANVHLDYTLGYNFTERFQGGISGYVYKQVTGDSGSGAILGEFKGEGTGIGPSVSYLVDPNRPLVLQFQWMHDVHLENRLGGDWFVFTIVARIPPLQAK